jgi:hypothetical protein
MKIIDQTYLFKPAASKISRTAEFKFREASEKYAELEHIPHQNIPEKAFFAVYLNETVTKKNLYLIHRRLPYMSEIQ